MSTLLNGHSLTYFYTNSDQLAAIRSFRAYHNQALLWPNSFPLSRRATIYRYFTQCLSASFKSHTQANGTNGTAIEYVDMSYMTDFVVLF